ncbi:hypothetical protein NQ317_011721 [Molorchus minor]|uniref:Ketosynthase family 3 (KS3) domain-containing protein n=1 Tax=Molorchus minor TaxID=1323400 RepID=A0ABQ9IRC6_9CUCU|nr:hypothetical protein NQ317_011721 [Molorchus minor]
MAQRDISENTRRPNILGGKMLASTLPGEEIVISGISGAFPNSKNVHEFRDNLFNKVNMVTPKKRFTDFHPEIPKYGGIIPDANKFDAGFFGIHERQSNSLDTFARLMQEKTIEAIYDAGLHPSDFEGTKTGVFIGGCFSESEISWCFDKLGSMNYAVTGSLRSIIAHRISYFLKLKGPSYITDTACSSSLYALEHAFRAIRLGEVDMAIVGGVQLCLLPFVTLQFARLGVLSKDGFCKVFDKNANGYSRSEAVGVIILQKSKVAKRVYARIVHAKTNCDGYKEQGITYPSGKAQTELLKDFYTECLIDPRDLSYMEAHGTGTFVGDPEEGTAIDDTMTANRRTPLLIGSVKSNIGHTEPASGVCSIIKCIIALETGYIPPNINFKHPQEAIRGLIEGRLKVVTDKIPFEDDRGLIGVNSFGFGGGNCHVLLQAKTKKKVNQGLPRDNLPRLVCVSGRTEEAVTSVCDEISENVLDVEHIRLLHDVFSKNIKTHIYRGYILVSKSGELARSVRWSPEAETSRPLYIAFGEMKGWQEIGRQLLELPAFAESVKSFN